MRKCCGYYCAMIAVIAVFFYGVIIVMEVRKNQFILYKMQFPEEPKNHNIYNMSTSAEVAVDLATKADDKVIALVIAIVVSHLRCG